MKSEKRFGGKVRIIPELCDKQVKQFFNGYDFILCLTNNKELYRWKGTTYHSPEIMDYFNYKNIVQVCCGSYHSSVLTSDGNVHLWGKYDDKFIEYPIECHLLVEIESIYCLNSKTFCVTKGGRVFYCIYAKNTRMESICIDTISNINSVLEVDSYIIFISRDLTINIFRKELKCERPYKIINNLNFPRNLRAVSRYTPKSIVYNEKCVYEFKFDETYEGFWETKYKNPFDYYCDKYGLTFETIELNVKEDMKIVRNITSLINNRPTGYENELADILKPFQIANKILNQVSEVKYFHVIDMFNMWFVKKDDNVLGFGLNQFGLCGFGHNNSVSEPQFIKQLCYKNVINFFNGYSFAMALTSDNVLYVWGVINDQDNSFSIPKKLFSFESEILKICCSSDHTLILTEEGFVYGWGNNECGQIEMGQPKFITKLLKLDKLISIKSIACCNSRSYAVNEENIISIWGKEFGEIKKHNYNISNICVTDSLLDNLYLLTNDGTISYYFSKTNSFEIIKFHHEIEYIISVKLNEIIALTREGFIYKINLEPKGTDNINDLILIKYEQFKMFFNPTIFEFKNPTIFEYYANEFQMTYKTIDLELQNVIETKSLKVTGIQIQNKF